MSYLKSYRELIVWQKSIELAKAIYSLTSDFPKSEVYGITAQMRRSVVSISSNIAEGYGRNSNGEYKQFLGIAFGSAQELETQLVLCQELKLAKKEKLEKPTQILEEVSKMLFVIMKKLS